MVAGPFDARHFYVQWGGKLPGGEEWSCGFRMLNTGAHNQADGPNLLIGIGAALAAYHARPQTQISDNAKLSFVKVNSIELDGHYTLETTNEATYADIAGGGTGNNVPNQMAWAVSLTTGFSRGTAHRGRFYLPLPVALPEDNGVISEAEADVLRISTQTMRTDVNAVLAGYGMAVMSRKVPTPGHRAVTGIEVGRVLDTQRRRRRSLVENYQ